MFKVIKKGFYLFVCLNIGFSGFGQFNTVVKKDDKLVVSVLETLDSLEVAKKDSVAVLLKNKKVEYNMGVLPLDNIYVTSFYGRRKHPINGVYKMHHGVDLRADEKMVYAVQKGIIKDVGYDLALGEYIKLECGAFEFVYGHLKHIYVVSGATVKMGQIIGKTGGTGRVTANHLHFAIKSNGGYVDPYPILELIFNNLDAGSSTSSE